MCIILIVKLQTKTFMMCFFTILTIVVFRRMSDSLHLSSHYFRIGSTSLENFMCRLSPRYGSWGKCISTIQYDVLHYLMSIRCPYDVQFVNYYIEDDVIDTVFEYFSWLWTIWEFFQTVTKKNYQVHCTVMSTITLTENLSSNVSIY